MLLQIIFFLLYILSGLRVPQKLLDLGSCRRVVCVFSHSSLWDSFYLLVITFAFHAKFHAACYYSYFDIPVLGWLLRQANIIPVRPKKWGGEGKFTEQMIEALNKEENFVFLISPQGGCNAAEWSSGYYHIAQKTNAEICVIGIDYRWMNVMMSTKFINPHEKEYTEVERLVKHDIAHCIALHPNNIEPKCVSFARYWGLGNPFPVSRFRLFELLLIYLSSTMAEICLSFSCYFLMRIIYDYLQACQSQILSRKTITKMQF